VIARSAEGGISLRATRVTSALTIDGRLDEAVYEKTPAIGGFVQQDPDEGRPATERTDAWIFFDDKNLYIAVRCWDSHPERQIANEMRRDSESIGQNENFAVLLDTFHDKRNGLVFNTNTLGALSDFAVTNETDRNIDWNTVWDVRTATFDGGWTVEFVIPFKSLRYASGAEQVWGINLRRIVRWKNESSFLSFVPSYVGTSGILRSSLAVPLHGLDVPGNGLALELKPSVISGLRTDRNATPAFSNQREGEIAFDAKLNVTRNLTLDATYNTDFAQVEDDIQQVNLTRFNLLYPEKREFFLEGQGIFNFGGVATSSDMPMLFFSRQIGIDNGRRVPIAGGGRLTGKTGAYGIGVINIQTGEDDAANVAGTNFTVARVRRDIFRRSTIGALFTRRSTSRIGDGANETLGIDGNFAFFQKLRVTTYLARTRTPGLRRDDGSHSVFLEYLDDRYGAQFGRLSVGEHFNPEVGFIRRVDFDKTYGTFRIYQRPKVAAIRRMFYQVYYEDTRGRTTGIRETDDLRGTFRIEFQNSDRFTFDYDRWFERFPKPFRIAPGVIVPEGGYPGDQFRASYLLGQQRRLSGTFTAQRGTFYGGVQTSGSYAGRVEVTTRLALEPTLSLNQVDLPHGAFTITQLSTRATFTVSPRTLFSGLVQYSSTSRTLSTNLRLRWEFQPGSELFVVYSDGRNTLTSGFPEMTTRALVVKATRLFRF
jgi:hypothetical protein